MLSAYPANILYRPDIGFYIGPISARCRMCNSATHRADIGNRYRLPTCSRYCADIQMSSLFLAKTPYFWLLKPSAYKIGKGKTGECINFIKFIYTNFKATFLAISKKTLYLSVQWQEQVKSSQLSTGMASVEGCIYYFDMGMLCCLWRYWHLILRWLVQSCRKPEFLLHFFQSPAREQN